MQVTRYSPLNFITTCFSMTTSLAVRSHQYEPKSLSVKFEMCRLYSPRALSSIIFILSCSFLLISNPSDIISFSPRHIDLVEFATLHFNMTSLPISVYSVTSSWTLPWMVPKIRRTVFNVLLFLEILCSSIMVENTTK
jgi:hypothetical protein